MKHAFLILAHCDFYILEKTVQILDKENVGIYIHVDKKAKEFDEQSIQNKVKRATIHFIERKKIYWGGYSIIDAELRLFDSAFEKGYDYYHLMSGQDMLIKSLDYVDSFMEQHKECEFLDCDTEEQISSYMDKKILEERFQYYCLFRDTNVWNKELLIKLVIKVQKFLKIDRFKNAFSYGYGANWASLSHKAVAKLLENKRWVQQHFKHTSCADEIYKQTVLLNEGFAPYFCGNQRLIVWEPQTSHPKIFKKEDWETLSKSECLIARKFSTKTDKEIIDKLYEKVKPAGND